MDEATFRVVVNDVLPWFISGALFVLIAIWLRIRAGSSYVLLHRLYALVIGGSEFHDSVITSFWNERKDIERFNALFNTRARSINEIYRFKNWIEKNDLDIRIFTRLRVGFDFEKRKVNKISRLHLTAPFVWAFFLVLVSMPLIFIGLSNFALLKFKGEGQWFWLNHYEAFPLNYNPFHAKKNEWFITAASCSTHSFDAEGVSKLTSLSVNQISAICQSFVNTEDKKRIDEIINDQAYFLFLAAVVFFYAVLSFMEATRRVHVFQARCYLLCKLKTARRNRKS